MDMYKENSDGFCASLFDQKRTKFGDEFTLADGVFGVVEDTALGRRNILTKVKWLSERKLLPAIDCEDPDEGDSGDQRDYFTRRSVSGGSGASLAAALGVSPNDQ